MKYLCGNNRMVLLVLLSLLTAANTPYSTVLCIGPHGHVAIEPAGHHHGCPATDTPNSSACVADSNDTPEDEHNHCCPCTDIPLSGGSSNHQIVRGTSKVDAVDLLAAPMLAILMPEDCVPSSISASTDFLLLRYISLRSIVLQV